MAKIRSDAHLYLTETGAAAPTAGAITSITAANPAVLTLTVPVASAAVGDMVLIDGTGKPELDGYAFRISVVASAGAALTLEGFDGTAMGGAVGAVGTATVYELAEEPGDGDLLHACVATITVAGQAPDSLSLDDMCSSTTVLGTPKPPTFQFTGWVDAESEGFANLVQASLESPKQERWLLIDYGTEGGYIFGPVEIGEMSITAGVNAGLAFSGSGVFKEMPTYSWAVV
jgi:hypothetical protein